MASKPDLHGGVFGKHDIVAPGDDVTVNGPASSIKGKGGADRSEVGRQTDQCTYETETRAAPHGSSSHVGTLWAQSIFDAIFIMRVETIERGNSQKNFDGWS